MYAHCYRSGEIELSRKPELPGAILIGKGPKQDIEAKLAGRARLAYDGETWLVPGIPEAECDDEAEVALAKFKIRFAAELPSDLPKHTA